jgi:L-alanine-DL-glutamate epimerase-like enolase superfamily enzyme
MNRRTFVKNAGVLTAAGVAGLHSTGTGLPVPATIQVTATDANFEREPLIRPFGFKGGYLTELWQTASRLQSSGGKSAIGIATQSVLYGDANLFAANPESGGNALMYALTCRALELIKRKSFTTPIELVDAILPDLADAAKKLTGRPDTNPNFVYNAMVSADNAAWLLYAAENNFSSMDAMIPAAYQKALAHHNEKIAVMYQVPYGMPMDEVKKAVERGYFVIKIKAGAPGTQAQMLEADMDRLSLIHDTLKNLRTHQTSDGKLIYTIDANARYEKKQSLLRYLDHAKKIGAFTQVQLFEEPLQEKNEEHVADTGIRIGADESVHTEADALRRLEQGYTAMVLKGIAKTLSMSMKIAKLAHDRNVPCMCADLTVNPILIDWQKNLAARLTPFPGIGMGLMETNGDMNYTNWQKMVAYHPAAGASWMEVKNGAFELDKDFYDRSGGILQPSLHYQQLFATKA